ncbi:hypothetical protein PInf_016641 [Phytophthora infestans]|nr:hypothetical protein PInf_016641 [Phytophthora infestans]
MAVARAKTKTGTQKVARVKARTSPRTGRSAGKNLEETKSEDAPSDGEGNENETTDPQPAVSSEATTAKRTAASMVETADDPEGATLQRGSNDGGEQPPADRQASAVTTETSVSEVAVAGDAAADAGGVGDGQAVPQADVTAMAAAINELRTMLTLSTSMNLNADTEDDIMHDTGVATHLDGDVALDARGDHDGTVATVIVQATKMNGDGVQRHGVSPIDRTAVDGEDDESDVSGTEDENDKMSSRDERA